MREQNNPVCVGVGPGNGEALARKYAHNGYQVAMLARDRRRLDALASEIPRALAVACDVTDGASIAAAVKAVEQACGRIDVLVYNVGKGVWGDVLGVAVDEFEMAWKTNTMGAFLMAREVLPGMLDRKHGTILFIGATASRRGAAGAAAFASAKGAQRLLAESMARAYGPKGVHVALIVIDAVVDEPLMRQRLPDRPDAFFCKPDDIADTALALTRQAPSAWTFELEVRPSGEKW